MDLATYKKTVEWPLRDTTLVFLLQGDEVLLAMKKRGFGAGCWNGVGGKIDGAETIPQAAVREAREEIGVTIDVADLESVAQLDFFFPTEPKDKEWNQRVHVFFVREWQGEPSESEEMLPKWFAKDALPLDEMWDDDYLWLPLVLSGATGSAEFAFGPGAKVIAHTLDLH